MEIRVVARVDPVHVDHEGRRGEERRHRQPIGWSSRTVIKKPTSRFSVPEELLGQLVDFRA